MKKIWVDAIPWNKEKVTAALEGGADAVLVPEGYSSKVKELGVIRTISGDGDLKIGRDVVRFTIRNKKDEEEAVRLSGSKILIIRTTDWTIIPLENLIAQTQGLMAEVRSSGEAKTAVRILEKGVEGVVIKSNSLGEIRKTIELMKSSNETLKLQVARITEVRPVGMGDRVCIDTCTNMGHGQGILAGNAGGAMFLVHSESVKTPYVAQRPFRVNAGAVHAYTLAGGGKTKYLSEIKSGDEVLVVDHRGRTVPAVVGRTKTEKRPMMLVRAKCGRKEISLVMQNAETIRLTAKGGKPVSIVSLDKKSEVLVYLENEGRHFGMKVDETITEK